MTKFLLAPQTVMVLFVAVAMLLLQTSSVTAADLCRCEADFEQFYGRRRLGQASRRLMYPYDYSNAYVDDEGYNVVEGVRVLPKSECSSTTTRTNAVSRNSRGGGTYSNSDINRAFAGYLSMFGGGRDLEEEENAIEENDTGRRGLGMMSGGKSGGMRSGHYDYYDYGGKHIVFLYLRRHQRIFV